MNERLFNIEAFHQSTTEELFIIKDRARNLIGNKNWRDEGRYKEAILRTVLRRYLPRNLTIGTGHVVKPANTDSDKHECSKEIDILIFDSSNYPVLFSEGDFHVITPDSVRAIIEVKTNIENDNSGLAEIIRKSNKNGEFIARKETGEIGDRVQSRERTINRAMDQVQSRERALRNPIFNGIFSFEGYENLLDNQNSLETVKEKIKEGFEGFNCLYGSVNNISLNKDVFARQRVEEQLDSSSPSMVPSEQHRVFSIYKLNGYSFSQFISNLVTFLSYEYNHDYLYQDIKKMWFPFDKSVHLKADVPIC